MHAHAQPSTRRGSRGRTVCKYIVDNYIESLRSIVEVGRVSTHRHIK